MRLAEARARAELAPTVTREHAEVRRRTAVTVRACDSYTTGSEKGNCVLRLHAICLCVRRAANPDLVIAVGQATVTTQTAFMAES